MLNSEKHRENFKFFMCNTINIGERPAKRTKIFYVMLIYVGVKWFK